VNISLADLRAEHAAIRSDLDVAIARVIESGQFIGGPEVEAFERELAASEGVAEAVGVSSGTDALLVLMMALGIGVGDEVVTTPFTFFATAGAIARVGARPVFADIEADSFNLDPAAALAAVTDRTRAILTVNLYGRPATLPETDVPIVEDAAQSIGLGRVRGLAAAMSFFPTKNLGAMGDAGAVLTDSNALADRVRMLRSHGARPKYVHRMVGGNFRLDALQAAILRVKLGNLGERTAARRRNAARYRTLFAAAELGGNVTVPADSPDHVYHHFVIRAVDRDRLRAHLGQAGVATEVYYPVPLHMQPCFVDFGYRDGSLPNAEVAAREALAVPVHPGMTAEAQAYVVDRIAEFYARA
jgi:dTDP-4-amino-4,6-dideoxygalactose transaminase